MHSNESLNPTLLLLMPSLLAVNSFMRHDRAKGEPAWSPLAMFEALMLSMLYDLSDVKPAEALDDRASFRTFRGFSRTEATP